MTAVKGIEFDEVLELMNLEAPADIYELIFRAGQVREKYCGNKISTCAIINAKSGNCGENCAFCPQSVHSSSKIDVYPLKSSKEILAAAAEAEKGHAQSFGIVTSGRAVCLEEEINEICDAARAITSETGIAPCASLGIVDRDCLKRLKAAGIVSYHHNLEASASYYPEICTTRTFEDNVNTLREAKAQGMMVCSGGLFGLGESNRQRVELFDSLRDIGVDSVPINFLNAIPGTPIEKKLKPLTALECLKIIAVARLMMPDTQIRICGGREKNLRDMQSFIFVAGANAVMIGSYLTTGGRGIDDDMQMIKDAGMELSADGGCGIKG